MSQDCFDCAVVGAGPAGIACSIQLKRLGVESILIEKARPGGSLAMAWRIENLPLATFGVRGAELVENLIRNLAAHGIESVSGEVRRVMNGPPFYLELDSTEVRARSVVIATGARPAAVDLPAEMDPFVWTSSDLPQSRGDALILGGGDVAFDQAGRWAEAGFGVVVAHRSLRHKALPVVVERALGVGATTSHLASHAPWVVHSDGFSREETGEGRRFRYLVPHIGRVSAVPSIFGDSGKVNLGRTGTPGPTEIPGLFLAGDAARDDLRHCSCAIADGISCAQGVSDFLKSPDSGAYTFPPAR